MKINFDPKYPFSYIKRGLVPPLIYCCLTAAQGTHWSRVLFHLFYSNHGILNECFGKNSARNSEGYHTFSILTNGTELLTFIETVTNFINTQFKFKEEHKQSGDEFKAETLGYLENLKLAVLNIMGTEGYGVDVPVVSSETMLSLDGGDEETLLQMLDEEDDVKPISLETRSELREIEERYVNWVSPTIPELHEPKLYADDFTAHPRLFTHHGFTCPICGGHSFKTTYLPATSQSNGLRAVGCCHGSNQHASCAFKWLRGDIVSENRVMHYFNKVVFGSAYYSFLKQPSAVVDVARNIAVIDVDEDHPIVIMGCIDTIPPESSLILIDLSGVDQKISFINSRIKETNYDIEHRHSLPMDAGCLSDKNYPEVNRLKILTMCLAYFTDTREELLKNITCSSVQQ